MHSDLANFVPSTFVGTCDTNTNYRVSREAATRRPCNCSLDRWERDVPLLWSTRRVCYYVFPLLRLWAGVPQAGKKHPNLCTATFGRTRSWQACTPQGAAFSKQDSISASHPFLSRSKRCLLCQGSCCVQSYLCGSMGVGPCWDRVFFSRW